jgi:hypothetical protein
LIRAMSFVAIPGLVGPMLGPIAGGLIVVAVVLILSQPPASPRKPPDISVAGVV